MRVALAFVLCLCVGGLSEAQYFVNGISGYVPGGVWPDSPFTGDLDGDGNMEIITRGPGGSPNDVRIHDLVTGELEFSTNLGSEVINVLVVTAIAGGWPAGIAQTTSGGLYVILHETVGSNAPSLPVTNPVSLLQQNAPNPFNPSTTMNFTLASTGDVELVIFDVSGRMVRQLIDARLDPGAHTLAWDGRDDSGQELPSGTYFYQLSVDGKSVGTEKAIALR